MGLFDEDEDEDDDSSNESSGPSLRQKVYIYATAAAALFVTEIVNYAHVNATYAPSANASQINDAIRHIELSDPQTLEASWTNLGTRANGTVKFTRIPSENQCASVTIATDFTYDSVVIRVLNVFAEDERDKQKSTISAHRTDDLKICRGRDKQLRLAAG